MMHLDEAAAWEPHSQGNIIIGDLRLKIWAIYILMSQVCNFEQLSHL